MARKENEGQGKKKGAWECFIEKLDKKMEERVKKMPCCGVSDKKKDSSCC